MIPEQLNGLQYDGIVGGTLLAYVMKGFRVLRCSCGEIGYRQNTKKECLVNIDHALSQVEDSSSVYNFPTSNI